jgi:hypothetical protein
VGLIPIAVEASDQGAIEQRAEDEGGAGVYENVVSDSSIDEDAAALDRANALLRKFARIDEQVSFELDVLSVRQGQLIEIDLPDRGVQGEYLLDEVRFKVKDNNKLRASVNALSGEPYGSWTKYFRELKQAKQEFTIRENEKVLLQRRSGDEVSTAVTASLTQNGVEDFIIGADGSTVGGGDSRLGYSRIGAVGHEEGFGDENVSATESESISSSSTLTTTIGTDEIGFTVIG